MIFITLGSQKFQFNRLLKAVDNLVEMEIITDEVFAQIGYSDYQPKCYPFEHFLDREQFAEWEANADIVITHGGTGAIIGALKKGKKVIAVPRLAKYGEHVDDHQLQLIEQFTKSGLICSCDGVDKLGETIENIRLMTFDKYQSNTKKYLESIDKYVISALKRGE